MAIIYEYPSNFALSMVFEKETSYGKGDSRRIVDPEEYENFVSPTNKRLMKEFLTEKKSQNKAPGTIKQYHDNMRILLTFIYRHFDNKPLTSMTRKDIRNLSIMLQERSLSGQRVNSYLVTLRSALAVFENDDDIDYEYNVGSRVKGIPKDPVREITFLSEEQIQWLKSRLIANGDILKAMYLMMSYISAARRNEVHQVLKEGLDKRFITNQVIGKRRKKFRLYYTKEVQDLIQEYFAIRGKDLIPQLFVKLYKNGSRKLVHPATFNAWCLEMGEMLTEQEGRLIHINPHCFRHSRLENMSRQGVPLEKLKSLANHKDVSTTASYLAERQEDDIAEMFGMDPSAFAC